MSPARTRWALAAILLLALAVRAWDLGGPSLWNDELFSRYYPRLGLAYLWGPGWRQEPTPPLYYTLLALWMRLFGEGEAAMRALGVAFSLAEIPLAFWLARRLAGTAQAGLLAALCLTLAPENVWYAQEARSYALEGLGTLLALAGLALFLQAPRRWTGLALYAAGALLAVYAHVTAGALLATATLAFCAARPGWPALRRWAAANLMVAALCLPLLPLLLSPATSRAVAWMDPVSGADLAGAISLTVLGPAAWRASLWLAPALTAALILLLAPRPRPDRLALIVLALVPLLSLALMALASLRQPMLAARTTAWIAIPLSLLLGIILHHRRPAWRAAVLATLAAALALQLATVREMKEDWRGFLATLAPRLAPPALVALAPWMPATAMEAYAPGVTPLHGLPIEGEGSVEWTVIPPLLGVQPLSWEALADAIQAGRPVWIIGRGAETPWLLAHLATLPPWRERVEGSPGYALRW